MNVGVAEIRSCRRGGVIIGGQLLISACHEIVLEHARRLDQHIT